METTTENTQATTKNGRTMDKRQPDMFDNAPQIESSAPRVYAQIKTGNVFRGYLTGVVEIPDNLKDDGSMRQLFIIETDAPCMVVGKEGSENEEPHEVPAGSLIHIGGSVALQKLADLVNGPFLTGVKIQVGEDRKLEKGKRMHTYDVWAVRTKRSNPNFQQTKAIVVDEDVPF